MEVLHSSTEGLKLGILDAVGTRDIYINGGWRHPYCDQNFIESPCSHRIPIDLLILINNEMVDCVAKWKCMGENGAPFNPIALRNIRKVQQFSWS